MTSPTPPRPAAQSCSSIGLGVDIPKRGVQDASASSIGIARARWRAVHDFFYSTLVLGLS